MAQTYQRLQTSIKGKERVITELVDRTNEQDYRTCKDYSASKDELQVMYYKTITQLMTYIAKSSPRDSERYARVVVIALRN